MTLASSEKELRKKIFPVKLTESEWRILKLKAHEHTKGNISEWVRYAALNLSPRPQDVVKKPKEPKQ